MNPLFNPDLIPYYSIQLSNRFQDQELNPKLEAKIEEVMQDIDSFDPEQFAEFLLEDIFTYLKCSHQYYLNFWIPKLENTLFELHAKLCTDYWSVNLLTLSLNAYKRELIHHIDQEEKVLFAFTQKLIDGKKCEGLKDLALNHFIHTHDNDVIIEIDKLKQDVVCIDPELKGNLIVQVLFNQLNLFQHDLKVHGLIEDEVFIQKLIARVQP